MLLVVKNTISGLTLFQVFGNNLCKECIPSGKADVILATKVDSLHGVESFLWNSMEFREFSSLLYQIYYCTWIEAATRSHNGLCNFYLFYTPFFYCMNILQGLKILVKLKLSWFAASLLGNFSKIRYLEALNGTLLCKFGKECHCYLLWWCRARTNALFHENVLQFIELIISNFLSSLKWPYWRFLEV